MFNFVRGMYDNCWSHSDFSRYNRCNVEFSFKERFPYFEYVDSLYWVCNGYLGQIEVPRPKDGMQGVKRS
jgi:hypothetical protein